MNDEELEELKQKARSFDEVFEIVNDFKSGNISMGEYIDYILKICKD